MAINMKDRIVEFVKFKDAAKNSAGALTEGESGAKKFGNALKGIGFAVLITAIVELGTELWNIASGADDVARAVEGMNKAIANGNKYASERLQNLKDEVGLGVKTKQQYEDQIRYEVKLMNEEKKAAKERLAALEKTKAYKIADEKNPLFRTELDERLLARAKAERDSIFDLNAQLTVYNRELKDLAIQKNQTNEQEKETLKISGKSTKGMKDQTKAVEEFNAALLDSELLLDVFGKSYEELIQEVLDGWDEIRALSTELNNEMANDNTIVDIIPEVFTEAQLKELGVVTDVAKKKFEETKKWGDLTNQYLQRLLDERIEKLDAEIEASKKYQDSIQAQADAGIGNAQQSMAKEAQIQAEAQAKKEKLERRKAQFAATAAFLNTYLSEREAGKTAVEAFASASLDKVTIEGLINALPTFLEGSDRTQNVGSGVDGKGGFHAILHPDEMVFTKEEREAMGGLTREQVIAKVNQSEIKSFGNRSVSGWENVGVLSELNGLKTELQQVKQAIIDKPVNNIELGKITQKTMEIVHSIKAGNRTTQSTYIVK